MHSYGQSLVDSPRDRESKTDMLTKAAQTVCELCKHQVRFKLVRLFSSDGYKWALETKICCLNFTQDTNIPVFCNHICLSIAKQYGINDIPTM